MNDIRFQSLAKLLAMTAAVALLALVVAPALAQQRATADGHALDANSRVGSGRINDQQNNIDYNARNNVITGNVPGLQAFQGQVDYKAPGEFAGPTAGEQLYRFNRQSLSSAPTQLNAVGAAPTYGNYTSATTVYRNFSDPGASYRIEAQRLTGQRGAVFDPGNLSQGLTLTPQQQNIPSDSLGYVPIPSGKILQVNASPLLGVRESEFKVQQKAQSSLPPGLPLYQSQSDELNRPFALTEKSQPTDLQKLLAQSPTGLVQTTPTAVLGMQLQGQLQLESADSTQTLDENFAKLQTMVQQQLMNRKAAEGDQVYQRVLEKIQQPSNQPQAVPQSPQQGQQNQQNQGNAPQGGMGQPGAQQGGEGAGSGATAAPGLGGGTEINGLIMPTPEQLKQAEIKRQNAVRRAYGLPPLPSASHGENGGNSGQGQAGENSQNGGGSGQNAQRRQNSKSQGQGSAQDNGQGEPNAIVKELGYHMAPLQSLIASRKGRVNKMMAEAEKQMAAGKYFDAEASYQQVLIDEPKRPLARAGLVNAELGAGLIRTAAVNLHRLYDEHPELINLRYGEKLLPGKDRLKWIQQQLMKMISQGESAAYPGLMMAYLGHQVGSRSLIRYGLAVAQTSHPKDPLLTVLGRVWLASPAAAREQGGKAAPPQPSGK